MARRPRSASILAAGLGLLILAAPGVLAQHVKVEGTVHFESGEPAGGLKVRVVPTTGDRQPQSTKTKKNGQFVMPFVEFGKYRFAVDAEDHFVHRVDAVLTSSTRQVLHEQSWTLAAAQPFPDFDLRPGQTLQLEILLAAPEPEPVPETALGLDEAERERERLFQEANELARTGDAAGSNEILNRLVAGGDTSADVYYLLGANEATLARVAEAEKWLRKSLIADPRQPGAHAQLGRLAHSQGDTEHAVELYTLELEIDPGSRVAAINRAILLVELNRQDEAIEAFETLIAAHPDETQASSELAALYLGAGREADAAELLARVEDTSGVDPAIWFNIGAGLSNQKKEREAAAAYRKALEIDPNFADAIRELGFLALGAGDRDQARARFERYLELSPTAADGDSVRALLDALGQASGG